MDECPPSHLLAWPVRSRPSKVRVDLLLKCRRFRCARRIALKNSPGTCPPTIAFKVALATIRPDRDEVPRKRVPHQLTKPRLKLVSLLLKERQSEAKSEHRPLEGIQQRYPVLVIIATGPAPRHPKQFVLLCSRRIRSAPATGRLGETIRRPVHERETQAPRGDDISVYRKQPIGVVCPDLGQSRHWPGRRCDERCERTYGAAQTAHPSDRSQVKVSASRRPPASPLGSARTNLASTPEPSFAPNTLCRLHSGTLRATTPLHFGTESPVRDAPYPV